jgi:transposase-like protein
MSQSTSHDEKLAKIIDKFRRKCDCESCLQYRKENPSMSEMARQAGLNPSTLYYRIIKLGWDKNIATTTSLTTPRAYKKILKKLNK